MAQETAGTIGIPVLKNEILPALDTYAKRQERYERLKAAREQKAAELAAKKAAEDAKFVPKFESGKGGYFSHILEANQSKRINDALSIYKDPNAPTQTKMLVANEANRLNNEENAFIKDNDVRLRQAAEDLSKNKFRKVDEGVITNWAKGQSTFQTPEKFVMDVKSNPDLIDFDAIGKTAKDYKASDYTYGKAGNTRTVKMSPLFEYKFEKDPIIGAEVPVVTGVNGIEAQKLIESNPDIKDAYEVWTKNRAKQYQNDRTFYDPVTGSPMMIRPELAEGQAAKEFVEQTFGKYGTIKYGQQFTMPRKGGAGGGGGDQFTMSIATPAGQATHEFNVQSLDGKGNPTAQLQMGDVGSKDDVTYSYDKEYVHPANKKVRLLQAYEQDKLQDYIIPTPDGGYLLKTGFNYSNPTKRTLYFADKDLYFGGDEKGPYYKNGVRQNWSKIKKGDEIPPATAEQLISQSKKAGKNSGVVKEPGYEITANMYTGEEGDVAKRPSVKMFIPASNASEIKKHIEMEQQKKRRKLGPETTVEGLEGQEINLYQ